MQFSTDSGLIEAATEDLVIAGWTGRNSAAVAHHIAELTEIGVTPPSAVPLYYRVASSLLTQATEIDALGPATSGEVEPLLINHEGQLYLGLGSDHTDRQLEAVSVAASKQACAKPVASTLWLFDEVRDHLDSLHLRCDIEENGAWTLYQDGTLAEITALPTLVEGAGLQPGGAMLCGTLVAIGTVRPASAYRMRLTDPTRGRDITLTYRVRPLPIVA